MPARPHGNHPTPRLVSNVSAVAGGRDHSSRCCSTLRSCRVGCARPGRQPRRLVRNRRIAAGNDHSLGQMAPSSRGWQPQQQVRSASRTVAKQMCHRVLRAFWLSPSGFHHSLAVGAVRAGNSHHRISVIGQLVVSAGLLSIGMLRRRARRRADRRRAPRARTVADGGSHDHLRRLTRAGARGALQRASAGKVP